ncbi:MAG: permease-like cell division protein FtsX [bacterium]|nr:permease-like cell division protein FtsX [bacterium]
MTTKITFKRILKTSWLAFRRNGLLSTATVLVMTLTLFVIGGLLLMSVVAHTVLGDLENKIDISVYFVPNAAEAEVLRVKKSLELLSAVKEISYVSQESALADFRARHEGDEIILSSLGELEDNPLEASLNIKAHDPSRLSEVAKFLKERNYPIVDAINYFENQIVIDRLGAIVAGVRNSGLILIAVLAFIAVLVAFNTIRLAIYTAREEINVMRLVGATSWFIRGPFLLQGILQGAIAASITAAIFYPLMWFAGPRMSAFLPNIDLYAYFQGNFFEFWGILAAIGISLGVFSSLVAMRKYLQV